MDDAKAQIEQGPSMKVPPKRKGNGKTDGDLGQRIVPQ